jgi:translation initiation factor 1 (eIF-1/SUI1)
MDDHPELVQQRSVLMINAATKRLRRHVTRIQSARDAFTKKVASTLRLAVGGSAP